VQPAGPPFGLGQHCWPMAPHMKPFGPTQPPFMQLTLFTPQLVLLAAQVLPAMQQPPLLQTPWSQQVWPAPPHATHAPPLHDWPLPQFSPSARHAPLLQQPLDAQPIPCVAQHFCDGPPQPPHIPLVHSVRPGLQSVPDATHVLLLPQQAPPWHEPFGQHGPPAMPHATHIPFWQPNPLPHMLPGQHAMFAPPQATHIALEQTIPFPHA